MIRTRPARWFEILVARADAVRLATTLAGAACAQLETTSAVMPEGADADDWRQRYVELERRYGRYWPPSATSPPPAAPLPALRVAVQGIEAWAAAAAPVVAAISAAQREHAWLESWRAVLALPGFGADERAALAGHGSLAARLWLGANLPLSEASTEVLLRVFTIEGQTGCLALGSLPAIRALEQNTATTAQRLLPPPWLAEADAADHLAHALSETEARLGAQAQNLEALAQRHQLARHAATAAAACWALGPLTRMDAHPALSRLTGWTDDEARLRAAVEASGIDALLRFPAPPSALRAPVLLHNPWWASPYEAICRLLGLPAGNSADPSVVLAVVFPLLFGYMFGDFGQGLVLTAIGLACGQRWALARLFIPAGLSAAAFGLVFGSVFSIHGVLTPLWLEPLEHPLPVLGLPLLGGGVLLLASLGLGAAEARWQGRLSEYAKREAPALALCLGLLVATLAPPALRGGSLLAAGALPLVLVAVFAHSLASFAVGLAECLEKAFQLAVNTLSFIRVGAFAIAHAGISATLLMLAEAPQAEPAWWLIMILGNALVIGLEVLVVSIQTTRLVLFEFFTRFFTPSGREFEPLRLPASPSLQSTQETRHANSHAV